MSRARVFTEPTPEESIVDSTFNHSGLLVDEAAPPRDMKALKVALDEIELFQPQIDWSATELGRVVQNAQ